MKLGKMSGVLSRIMLAVFLFILIFPVLFRVLDIFSYKSYMAAFAVSAVIFAVYTLISRRVKVPESPGRAGSFRTGLVLGLICFAVNLAWVLFFRVEPESDYLTFWNTAVDLAENQPLRGAQYVAMFPHILGYSAFLSVFLRIFGESYMTAAVLNVFLTTASGLIIYALCLRWADKRAAAGAFLLWILCPSKLFYNAMVISEPYYTCLLLCFILIVSFLEERADRAGILTFVLWGIPAAVALAAVNTARPIAAIPIIAFIIWLLLLRGEKLRCGAQWKKWLSFLAVLLVLYALLGKLWNIYAGEKLGEEPSGTPGYSIYVGFNPDTMGSYSDTDMDRLQEYRFGVYGNAAEAQEKMLEEAEERIKAGEVPVYRLFAEKLRTLLGNDEGGVYYSRNFMSGRMYSVLAVISNVFYYFTVMLAFSGTLRLWKRPEGSLLLVPLYAVGLGCAHMLVEVAGRYHYSVIPMFIILSALSFASGGGREKPRLSEQ